MCHLMALTAPDSALDGITVGISGPVQATLLGLDKAIRTHAAEDEMSPSALSGASDDRLQGGHAVRVRPPPPMTS
jgi:hypothetical protein